MQHKARDTYILAKVNIFSATVFARRLDIQSTLKTTGCIEA